LSVMLREDRTVPPEGNWVGGTGGGLWSVGSNWDTGKLPQTGDDVIINTVGTVTFDANVGTAALKSLTANGPMAFTGGTLTTTSSALFAGTVTQSGGTLGGTGLMTFQKSLTTNGGSTFTGPGLTRFVSGANWLLSNGTLPITLSGRDFESSAVVQWTGSGSLLTNDGSLVMKTGSSFNSTSTGQWQFNSGVPGSAAGTPLTIESGAALNVGAATLFQGAVNVNGTANFGAAVTLVGGGLWSGTISGTGSVNMLANVITLAGAASVPLAGGITLNSGLILTADAATQATIGKLNLAGGVLGGTGRVTIANNLNWTGGFMNDLGETVLGAGAIVSLDSSFGSLGIDGRTITNNTLVTWIGDNPVNAGPSNWINKPGSSFEVRGTGTWSDQFSPGLSASFVLESGASLKKTLSTGTATFLIPVFNSGTIQVDTGALNLAGGLNGSPSSLSNGNYVLTGQLRAPGLTVVDNSANITLNGPNASLINSTTSNSALASLSTNSGTITLTGNSSLTLSNKLTNSGTVNIGTGVRLDVNGAFIQTGGTTIVNGDLAPSKTAANGYRLQGGTLKGTGNLLSRLVQTGGQISPGNSPGRFRVVGAYNQGGSLLVELNGTVSGIDYDQIVATDTVTLGGTLDVNRGFNPIVGQVFTIIDNQSALPVVDTFTGLPEGAFFNVTGMRFKVSYMGGDGNDVTLTRVATGIEFVQPGAPGQCSVIREVTVKFNGLVSLGGTPANAFTLDKTNSTPTGSVGIAVASSDSATETTATITFTGGAFTDLGGLADGKYKLTTLGMMITDPAGGLLDGAGLGTPGSNGVTNFNRLYGDIDCDGDVDGGDFLQFRINFLTNNPGFDIDGDGDVDSFEFLRFRVNFLKTLPP
ncbi:MAG: hypothetical protein K1X57_21160, partial [Gemmataceae bacterium]|nr:hypothetical protein [Gemmataceae bacterium]